MKSGQKVGDTRSIQGEDFFLENTLILGAK